jgi:outer membrane protein assembly factor BamA
VRSEYGRLGYLDLTLDAQPVFSAAQAGGTALHKVLYRISLHEGPQYRMGEMVITGLSLAAERKLLAVWRVQKGEVFDNGFFENLVAELERNKEPVFGDLPVHYDQVGRWLRKNPEAKTVDVLLDFK